MIKSTPCVSGAGQTRGVDLIMQTRLGAPFPTRSGSRSSTSPGPPAHSTCSPRLLACGVAGLGSLPNGVVALSAVPDLRARPLSTRPSLPGANATACGPVPRAKRDHNERRLEINPARRAHDRRKCDIGRKYAAHVPFLLISNECRGESGPRPVRGHATGTVSSRTGVPPGRGRPPERPCDSALIPTLPSSHVRGRRERGRHTRTPGSCATRSVPSRGRRAHETRSARPRSPERAESGSASGQRLSTHSRSTSLLSRQDRITMLSTSTVWITGWVAFRAY